MTPTEEQKMAAKEAVWKIFGRSRKFCDHLNDKAECEVCNGLIKAFSEVLASREQAAAENAARAVQDAMWHALLFKSRCHNTRLEGATSYPCVCCEDAVKKVGDAGIAAAAPFLKGK